MKFLFIFFSLYIVVTSCKKRVVEIKTNSVSSISSTSAVSGGNISSDGGSNIIARGVCWSTSSNPVLASGNYTSDGTGTGEFSSIIVNLKHKTTYYVRAYATNGKGTTYGNEYSFTTPPLISSTTPIVYTYDYINVDTNSRTLLLKGEVMHEGGGLTTERGFVWSNKKGPSITDSVIEVSKGIGNFSFVFSFEMGSTYYVKSFATNSFGTAYGQEIVVIVNKTLPKTNTIEVTEIDSTTAYCSGSVTYGGGTTIVSKGICWAAHSVPTVNDFKSDEGSGLGTFTSIMSDLLPSTTYYCRSYAVNSEGVTYGKEVSFKTVVSKLYIGLEYKGGIIFYINVLKDGGLLVSKDDLSAAYPWGCSGLTISGATSKSVGSGQGNTNEILASCSTGAAKLCSDYKVGKYDDWFLPSYDELALIYNNLKLTDLEKFSIGYYWASTQKSNTVALRYGFLGGNTSEAEKSTNQFVRAVRKF